MAKRRDQIRMTEDELWDFVRRQKSLQVATLDRSGAPHLTTLWFAVVDGAIAFSTYTKSQKIKNLERDPRCAVLVEEGSTYDELKGVSIQGRARLHRDPEIVKRYAREIQKRYRPGLSDEEAGEAAKRMAAKRTLVVVEPERIMSWDHSKLG